VTGNPHPRETRDIASTEPEVLKRLEALLPDSAR